MGNSLKHFLKNPHPNLAMNNCVLKFICKEMEINPQRASQEIESQLQRSGLNRQRKNKVMQLYLGSVDADAPPPSEKRKIKQKKPPFNITWVEAPQYVPTDLLDHPEMPPPNEPGRSST